MEEKFNLSTTITVRGVNSKIWKEFQSNIVKMHGNLYGNIGEEVTNALNLWLDRYKGRRSVIVIPASSLAETVSYESLGGLKKEIEMIREIVEAPLRHPEIVDKLGLVPSKCLLIHGPPGTGKNLLAKAATAEAKANLYVLSLQQIISQLNETVLRSTFDTSKQTAPSVILIPDLRLMTKEFGIGSGDPKEQVLSWLISEIDALDEQSRVVVIGIVSSPEELDSSLRQRFHEEIEVSLPTRQGRCEILKLQTQNMPLAEDVDLDKLADMTDNYEGSLLQAICQQAARNALRRTLQQEPISDKKVAKEKLDEIKILMSDFIQAFESINQKTRKQT